MENRGSKPKKVNNLPKDTPFRRSDAARILSVSLPTIDRMVEDGRLQTKIIEGTKFIIRK